MHNIHPNTTHQIVTISLAVRCGNECDAADAVNEAIRPFLMDDASLFADYSLNFGGTVTSSDEPEEGDLTETHMDMTQNEKECINLMRARGYCIVIFNPGELGDVDPDRIADGLVADGLERVDLIQDLQDK